jgi:sugar lactone lactonase YvrE
MQTFIQRILILFSLVSLTSQAFGQTGVSTFAGSGTAGFSGDGGAATSATLNGPTDIAVGKNGDLYIADRNNNRLRKVSAATGVITTAAGTGFNGEWYLEGGPAVSSVLNHPFATAADGNGNFYIGDFGGFSTVSFTNLYVSEASSTNNSRIHKVDAANGLINQVHPPIALTGVLSFALDAQGNLYFAERLGQRIFKVVPQSGALTPIAGTGTAGFSGDGGPATAAKLNNPAHIAFDAAGNLYVADSGNNRIRKIAAGTNIITTVAGSGAAGTGGDGGPAVNAQLNAPEGVAADSAGDVFIADTGNQRIRRVSAGDGFISTVVAPQATGECGSFTAPLQSPVSLVSNAAGDTLFIADDAGQQVFKADLHPSPAPPTLASIAPPSGAQGAQVTVTLTGTGFAGGANAACQSGGTAFVSVSGAGITVSSVTVGSDTSMTASFTIASDAAPGNRNITVANDGGTSGPVPFAVTIPVAPPPTLTSINPSSGVRGASVTVTFTGTNFDTHPGNTSVSADDAGLTVSQVSVTSATSLTAVVTVGANETLGSHGLKVATSSGSSGPVSFTVVPAGLSFTYSMPQMLNPTDQTPVQVALASPLPDSVTGTLAVTFTPNATNPSDDPNVTMVNGDTSTRNTNVAFPSNTLNANLSLSNGVLQAGTVAGTIQLSVTNVQDGGVSVTPGNSTFDIQVPQLPPVITGIRVLNVTAAGFDVEITGYSTPRDIKSATFDFGAATGQKLLTVELQPAVNSPFTTYYQSSASDATGSAFVYTQPFNIKQGTVNAVASVTVALANSAGTSQPATAQMQ